MSSALRLYKQELTRCRENFEQIDLQKERGYLMKFTTFSANMENIMPSIPRGRHEELFHELLLQQVFTMFDHRCFSAGDLIKLRGAHEWALRKDSPRIYCTYHFGSYRILTSLLFRRGLDCVLLVGNNTNRHQGDDILAHIDELRRQRNCKNSFRIIEAGHPSAGLSVLRELKAGKSLIVFVDGSPETAPEANETDKFLSVKLGSRRVWTRKGVGYLSHAAGVPIVPVVTYRQPDLSNVLHFLDPIRPIRNSDREMYCQEAMQQLYDALWSQLNQNPGQWEGWNYIQSFLEPEAPKQTSSGKRPEHPTFNEDRYTLCDLEQAPVLFDRRLYQTYEISEDLRDLLLNLNEVDSVEGLVGEEMFGELVEMGVLC